MSTKGTTIKVFRVERFKAEKRPIEASLELVKVEATATEVKTAVTNYEITLNAGKRVNVVRYILH